VTLPLWVVRDKNVLSKFAHEYFNELEDTEIIWPLAIIGSDLRLDSKIAKHHLQHLTGDFSVTGPNLEAAAGHKLKGVRYLPLSIELAERS
jgi:hypothetical protein